ncbi:reverse transcriptase domain-containing protein [Tanacetum coccineum]
MDAIRAERLVRTHDPLALMANSQNPYHYLVFHPDQPSPLTYMKQSQPNNNYIPQPSFNTNYMPQPMPNPEDISDPTTNELNVVPGIANPNVNPNGNGNVVAARDEGNGNGNNGNQIRCYNCRGLGHYAKNYTFRPRRRDAAYLQTQLLIAQKEEVGIQLHAEEFDLMVAAGILMRLRK